MKKNIWLGIFAVVLIWSGIRPKDYFTWFLEVLPAILALLVMAATYKRFPLTPLCYILILLHSIILMVGGHYTYAEVPLFDWISEFFGWQRNNYDKIGHLAQGFIPAIVTREILVRHTVVEQKRFVWLSFIVVSICLAISAFYELIEWWVAVLTGESAEAFLGTQGYVWDTQSDMALAMLGAMLALVFLSKVHNRQLQQQGKS